MTTDEVIQQVLASKEQEGGKRKAAKAKKSKKAPKA